jgi:hypothetical protein
METTTRYRRADGLSFTELDGELVCLNLETGEYSGLQDVGQTIWEHLDQPRDVDQLVRHVVAEYDVEDDRARADIEAFLSQLSEAGFVEVA